MAPASTTAVLLLAAFVAGVAAHGGVLHVGSSPVINDWARTRIASCSKWVGLRAPAPAVAVEGGVDAYAYLYKNCSLADGEKPSAGLVFNVTLRDKQTREPLSGLTLDGMAVTDTCANGGGEPYEVAPDEEELPHRRLWFTNYTTNATGVVFGTGANDGDVATSGAAAARAVLLVNTTGSADGSGAPIACCDLVPTRPAATNWSATLPAGKNCSDEANTTTKVADAVKQQAAAAGAPAAKSGASGVVAAGSVLSAALAAGAALLAVLA